MNATAIDIKSTHFRQNRIKSVASALRGLFVMLSLAYVFYGLFLLYVTDVRMELGFPNSLVVFQIGSASGKAVLCALAYKLFSCYANNALFSTQIIRWMRWIGIVNLTIGLGTTFFWLNWYSHLPQPAGDPKPWIYMVGIYVQEGLHYVDSNLLAGLLIIFIAWIMDEGRKIKEEQELTV